MTDKTGLQSGAATSQKAPVQVLRVQCKPGQEKSAALAENAFDPATTATLAAHPWTEKTMGVTGVNEALQVVREYAQQAAAGNLDGAKQMLMAQAITLNAIFTEMTRKAADCIRTDEQGGSWHLKAQSMQAIMGVAMKAQSQCRTTLEALNDLVNPRSVAFIRQAPGSQANVSQGAQQVNNGGQLAATARPQEVPEPANKLLEENPSERLDFGAQAAPSGANQELEAVGAVNWAKDGGGTVRGLPKRNQARAA
ncbi:hypothetical protein [Ramlibacter sp.]|uniref:hypothetical protein n=1 Tax=Ramlibacter sp. TaxID=1917967 RepID=UPI0026144229|nr:hypothetical protein [Ramlibacter sp.]MDB5956731.1 uncharacterized protein [Ramlibacter sp.]